MRPRTLFILLICNLIWSANPAMCKLILTDFSPMQAAWLRYFGALLMYLFIAGIRKWSDRKSVMFFWPRTRKHQIILIALGFLSFCFANLMQMNGLRLTRATDNVLIVAMEPLISIMLAWIILKEQISTFYLISLLVAMTGFGMLSGFSSIHFSESFDPELGMHLWGNLILLLSLFGEASFSILSKPLVLRYPALPTFGSAAIIGVSILTVIAVVSGAFPFPMGLLQMGWKSWIGILWIGPIGTTLTYYYWMLVLREAPVASAALTLFIQPVFGAFLGYWLLNERLSAIQLAGGALIFASVFGQTLEEIRGTVLRRV